MKTLVPLMLILVAVVSACSPAGTDQPVATPLVTDPPATLLPTETQPATPDPSAVPALQFTASPPAACKPAPIVPEGDAMQQNQVPAITETDWRIGKEDAAVTILTYCSYQKTACQVLVSNLLEIQQSYPDEVRIVYRHYPLPEVDDKSSLAARAAEAAGLQDRFWEMTRLLYDRQSDWLALSPQDFTPWLAQQAGTLGISTDRFLADLESGSVRQKVEEMVTAAAPLALSDTPVLFYNGVLVQSTVTLYSLEAMVKYFLLPQKGFTACPEMTIDSTKTYTATLTTEKGEMVFELYPEQAPWAVNVFVTLALSGWYNDSGFYRVVPGFVAQGGDPSNSGLGSPGFTFTNEFDPSLRFDQAGLLAMNNQGGDYNGSQFFITYAPLPEFDGQFTIFGRLVDGMSVLQSLRPRSPESDQLLLPPELLISVEIEVSD